MKKLFLLILLVSQASYAALGDYELRRLPASVANEFYNQNGNLRQFVPVSINDEGHLAGVRLTTNPDADRTVENGFTEASYIYDLNSREFIAQSIPGVSITYIGDGFYIGKRLHPSGRRWQTYRCAYAKHLENEVNPANNPLCERVDNEFLSTDSVVADVVTWRNIYQVSLLMQGGLANRINSPSGSTMVMMFNYDDPDKDISAIVHRSEAGSIDSDDVLETIKGGLEAEHLTFGDMEQAFLGFASRNGDERLFFGFPEGEENIDLVSIGLSSELLSFDKARFSMSDDQASVLAVSSEGYLINESGYCDLYSMCNEQVYVDNSEYLGFIASKGALSQPLGLGYGDPDSGHGFFRTCVEEEGAATSCDSGIYYIHVDDQGFTVTDALSYISSRFPEVALTGNPYSEGLYGADVIDHRIYEVGSPSGKYMVLVVPTTAREIQPYVFINK